VSPARTNADDVWAVPAPAERPISWRKRYAVIAPATNTVVEHDFPMIGPAGVTFHTGRMYLPNPVMGSDEDFLALLGQIRDSITVAVRDSLQCAPDRMVMGMSAETFWGGIEGSLAFEERIREQSGGLPVSAGSTSCREALEAFGAKNIAVFSPYQPIADKQVGTYFAEAGFSVKRITGLRCPTATSIAEVRMDRLNDLVIDELDGDDVDAIVQVGTNLSFVRGADALERKLGKPVIAINAATLWHALRSDGITDRFDGLGSLLREH
jgi:maleate isomerase